MYTRKLRDYGSYLGEMAEHGIAYRPPVWSTFGRCHPEAKVLLETLAIQAARRRGLRDHRQLLSRVHFAVGVALARRAARMVADCLPGLAADEEQVTFGGAEPAAEAERPEERAVTIGKDGADALGKALAAAERDARRHAFFAAEATRRAAAALPVHAVAGHCQF